MRSGGNQRVDPLSRPIPPIPGVGLDLDKDVIVDGEDHEPPAPAPSSRPHSPGNALGMIDSYIGKQFLTPALIEN